MQRIQAEGGVLVMLANEESSDSLLETVKFFAAEDSGKTPVRQRQQPVSRTVGVGSQILAKLGVRKMRLLSAPKKYHALSGFGLEVVEYVSQ